ncbi:MAG: DUF4430 domain-containing protein [Blautia sp.]
MKKDLLVLAFAVLLAVILLKGTKIQSEEDYYMTHADDITEDSEIVTLSIRCDTILDHYEDLDPALQDEKYVPKDGVILEPTEYVLRKGDSVFDILNRATRNEHIQMEYQGAKDNVYGSAYIQGINYIYEFSCGPLSGWMYRVDGEFPGYGISRYELEDGDEIELVYTCDLGRDVGGSLTDQKEGEEDD